MTDSLQALSQRVGEALSARQLVLTCAESCTGGGVAAAVTAIAGSSAWFDRGFVTYTNDAKHEMLGVQTATLEAHGAVSEAVVREMAAGALAHSAAQISLAVSGVAGPGGGSPDKPVGTVWLAWGWNDGAVRTTHYLFPGNRTAVREASVIAALEGVLDILSTDG